LWDTETGKEVRSLPIDQGARVLAMTFTPDSKHFAFNNHFSKGIQLVDVPGGKLIRTFMGHTDNVYDLTFTDDVKRLVSGSADNTIRVWDVVSGKELRRFGDEKAAVRCLALAPDGKTLTYGTYPDGKVHIWDIAANKDLVAPWKAHAWCVVSITYSPDSKKVAVGRDTIAIHETATGKRLNPTTDSESRVRQVEYAADGKLLAVWREDETIEIRDTATWRKTTTLLPKIGRFASMAFYPHSKYLTTAEGDSNQVVICHWDPQTGKRQTEFPQEQGWIEALSYSAVGDTLAFVHMGQHRVFTLLDPVTGKERARITDTNTLGRNPRLSRDGKLLAAVTAKHTVGLWETETQKLIRDFGMMFPSGQELLAFSPDGRTIATAGGQAIDNRIPIQPDLVLWETATGRERLHIAINEGQVNQIAFSPDGRLLASSGPDGRVVGSTGRTETIHLWDAWTGKEVGRLPGHRGWVNSLAFAPDGRTLVSGGADTTLLMWDICGLGRVPQRSTEKQNPDQLATFVRGLESENAAEAYRAIFGLANQPDVALGLLKKRLTLVVDEEARVARFIADLDDDEFAVREKASAELARLGNVARAALARAAANPASVEVRSRAKAILAKLEVDKASPEQLLAVRTVEVLERVATPEARQLLRKLADGAADASRTREAKAALERLERQDKRNSP
jgi:WD40 repeat protein